MHRTGKWTIGVRSACVVAAAALSAWLWSAAPASSQEPEAAGGAHAGSTPAPTPTPTVVRFRRVEPPVVAQREFDQRFAQSESKPELAELELSGLAWLGDRLLMSSDRHQHLLFVCRVDLETMTIGDPEPVQVIHNEQHLMNDVESISVRLLKGGAEWMAYAMCSQSNDPDGNPRPQRRHLLTFRFDPAAETLASRDARVIEANAIRNQIDEHFKRLNVEAYKVWNEQVRENTYRWGNFEGLTFAPDALTPGDGTMRMIVGMRNPLVHGRAFVAVFAAEEGDGEPDPTLVDLMTLDLGERGIAGMEWDPVTRGYLIVAGRSNGPRLSMDQPYPPNTLDSALFWWSGRKAEEPTLVARMPDMKVEAVCRLGDSPYIAVVSDEGDVSENRPGRQSVLTIMWFTGWGAAR